MGSCRLQPAWSWSCKLPETVRNLDVHDRRARKKCRPDRGRAAHLRYSDRCRSHGLGYSGSLRTRMPQASWRILPPVRTSERRMVAGNHLGCRVHQTDLSTKRGRDPSLRCALYVLDTLKTDP